MLWPADEPWPVCTHPRKQSTGERMEEVRLRRRILTKAWGALSRTESTPG